MGNPRVSVVIPAYNHERYVGEAIQSVLDQTFQDFELIIINDGSTDNTESEILKFKDNRIRYYSQENRGLSATLNRGIELARGEYFNFLPSDDAFFPKKLEIQLKAFDKSKEIGIVFSYQLVIDAEGREVKDDPIVDWFQVHFETKEEIFPALFERDFLSAPTALIQIECFRRVGLFDESLKTTQDYDLWMRILKYYDLRLIKKSLLKFRWHGANQTFQATSETEFERTKVLLKAYKDLTIEDIFPSLFSERGRTAYCQAYETLASYMEKSRIPALIPIAQIYRDQGKSLVGSHVTLSDLQEEEAKERYEFHPVRMDSEKIRILIETPSLDAGGMEEAIHGIATHLDPALFSPIVVCIERGGRIADQLRRKGVPVEILGDSKERAYVEILRRYQIDLVNSHFSFFGSRVAQSYGIPVVTVLHSLYSWHSGSILDEFRETDQYVSKYVAVSKQVASFFEYRFNIEPNRIKIIPGGIDLGKYENQEMPKEVNRQDLGFDEEDFIFLHVGAISPAKMQNLLMAGMKEIAKKHPKIKLLSLGSILDEDYSSFIRKKYEELGLEKCLKFIGWVGNPTPYYRIADAFLLPSLIEGWGIATLEAMHHGLPLILTKVGGAEELIENQDIGILIGNCFEDLFQLSGQDLEYYSHLDFPRNAPELIEAMLEIFQNRKEWKEKARDGKRKVESRYTWEKVVPQYEKEFLSLALEKVRQDKSRLDRIVRDQKKWLDEKERTLEGQRKEIKDIKTSLVSISTELNQRLNSVHSQLDYVLIRLSLKERIRERLYKYLKKIHKILPKKMREKYRFQYRRFFFDKVFPDRERFERPTIPSNRHNILSEAGIEQFLEFVRKGGFPKLFVVYTTDPYMESRGQRSTWLAKEFSRRGFPVVFLYWRWDQKEEIVKSQDPKIFSAPIDEFTKIEKLLFPFTSNQLTKVFLIEFPDSFLFEKVNLANLNSFVTIYDCIDDWEEFARAGQAAWYDLAVEKYLVHNVDLTIATNSILAERLRGMGAEYIPVIPNGVEMNSFQQKKGLTKIIRRGTLTAGYFGHLTDSWFDWDMLLRIASKRRDWVIHIIGYGEPSGLKLPDNIILWGKIEHHDLPSYAHSWDVAMIPFKKGRLAEAVDPIKLYEYLVLGLPVVATNMPQLQGTPGVFTSNRENFEETLILATKTPFHQEEVERFVRNSTWEKRVDQLLREIDGVDLSRDFLKGVG